MYTLILLHKLEASFGFYDTETGNQVKIVATRPFPHEICLDPDRKKLYIAEMGVRGIESEDPGGHTVAVYDARTGKMLSLIDTGIYDRPHGITSSGDKLFITSESTKNLLIYNILTEDFICPVYLGQDCAHMVSVTRDGKSAYTANIWSNTITAVNIEECSVTNHIRVPERPEGMVFSACEELIYCVCREAAAVAVVDRYSHKMIDRINTGNGPVRIAISTDGKILCIPLFHSSSVQFADTCTNKVTDTIQVGPHPAGICVSPDGKYVFISCEEENIVYAIDFETHEIIRKINTGNGADAMVCMFSSETE